MANSAVAHGSIPLGTHKADLNIQYVLLSLKYLDPLSL
jgi:hypothetical protein